VSENMGHTRCMGQLQLFGLLRQDELQDVAHAVTAAQHTHPVAPLTSMMPMNRVSSPTPDSLDTFSCRGTKYLSLCTATCSVVRPMMLVRPATMHQQPGWHGYPMVSQPCLLLAAAKHLQLVYLC
jgi:hypothetical protein